MLFYILSLIHKVDNNIDLKKIENTYNGLVINVQCPSFYLW